MKNCSLLFSRLMIIFGPSLNVVYVMYVYTESIADLQKGLQIVMGPVHDVSCCY